MPILQELLAFVKTYRAETYLVGGTVRDRLLGRGRYDIDLAVMGDAVAMARTFADRVGAAFYIMDQEWGVARVIAERGEERYLVDFANLRGDSIEEDLATRDFTINAMGIDLSTGAGLEGDLIDPFNGQDDLEARRIRMVTPTVFEDDPVRLLRAVRFEATLGFALDHQTEAAVRHNARNLVDAAPERVRDELCKILASDNCARHIRRVDDLGLLQFLLPEIAELKGVEQSAPNTYDVFAHTLRTLEVLEGVQRGGYLDLAEGAFASQLSLHMATLVSSGHSRGLILRLGTLLHDAGKPLAQITGPDGRIRFDEHEQVGTELAERALRRLRFSNDEIEILATLIASHTGPWRLARGPTVDDLTIYRYFKAVGDVGVDIAVHAWCDLRARSEEDLPLEIDAMLQVVIGRLLDRYYHERDRVIDPPALLTGRDILKIREIPQGPLVGKCLESLREAQVTGAVTNREQAISFVRSWQPDQPAG